MSPDERPGEPVTTLDELYDLVPQAEEMDLRHELERESRRRFWANELRPLLDPLDPALDIGPDAGPSERPTDPWSDAEADACRLTDGQVVGMLEHLLGAERVDGPDRD